MTKVLLSVHVLAVVIAVGPVAVAASMFPAVVRRAAAEPTDARAAAVMRILHRICRVYATIGVAVPVFGLATASSLHILGDSWLIVSIVLTAAAATVLALLVLPRQGAMVSRLDTVTRDPAPLDAATAQRAARQLGMYVGVFNLLWATVTVLMIVRPGSTTGV